MKFPSVQATNLAGRKYSLPGDFEGEFNLVLIAFTQEQQYEVDTWLPFARQLAGQNPALRYYELPTVYRGNPLFRLWLDSVMRAGIPDQQARAATITLYLDKAAFRQSLELPHENTIYALLVNRAGEVLWRAEGRFSPEKGRVLQQVLTTAG